MTDDERAFKYALERKKNLHLSQRDTNLICLAYLHGLKDGKPKWHDLRKNPNDLPQNVRGYLITLEYQTETFGTALEDCIKIRWFNSGYTYTKFDNVIAWCELPRFNKELAKE